MDFSRRRHSSSLSLTELDCHDQPPSASVSMIRHVFCRRPKLYIIVSLLNNLLVHQIFKPHEMHLNKILI